MARFTTFALAFATSVGFAGLALADTPGADWIPVEQVIQKLKAAGYSNISEVEADDGHWEGEGMKNGVKMEAKIDPKTGEILSEKPD